MKPRLPDPSSPLAPAILAFLAHKRALNRRYDVEDKALRLFDRYLRASGVESVADITPTMINAFLMGRPRARARSFNHLVGVIRRLFDWMVQQEIINESPVTTILRRERRTRLPCILDLKAGQRLIDVAARLPDRNNAQIRGASYAMIFRLLFGLGLRVGEVARLRCRDVDQDRDLLIIRETKFSKSRLIPMGPRMAGCLNAFITLREERTTRLSPDDPIFSFTRGRPINPGTISQTFHALLPQLDLHVPDGMSRPRVHDLRHSFAVGTLLRWYRGGGDPADRLMSLATFLGHVDPASTAVYLMVTSELLDAAAQRFERFAAPISKGSGS